MVEIVGERGYDTITVRELARLAGVSTRAFYEQFESKEECFLRTYELVVQRAAGRVAASQQGAHSWEEKLQLAFGAFAHEVVEKPNVARLALVAVFEAGPAAIERLRQAETMFETMIGESFDRAPDRIAVSPLIVRGIVSGVERVTRTHLLAGREGELPGLGDEMMEWALSYRCESAEGLPTPDRRFTPDPDESRAETGTENGNGQVHGDERALILAAVAKLAAADGYLELTVPRIRAAAGVPRRSFDANFEGVRDCFLAALELRLGAALSQAARGFSEGDTWPGGIHRALTTFCAHMARDEVLAKLAQVEASAPGPDGLRCGERLIANLTESFRASTPDAQRPSELCGEAAVGAVWGAVYQHVVAGRARRLPQIAPALSFLALAPTLGATEAVAAIRDEQQALARTSL
jgi:AcrR family transcriptional regulator